DSIPKTCARWSRRSPASFFPRKRKAGVSPKAVFERISSAMAEASQKFSKFNSGAMLVPSGIGLGRMGVMRVLQGVVLTGATYVPVVALHSGSGDNSVWHAALSCRPSGLMREWPPSGNIRLNGGAGIRGEAPLPVPDLRATPLPVVGSMIRDQFRGEAVRRQAPREPPVTKALLDANLSIYLLDMLFLGNAMQRGGAFSIASCFTAGRLWELVTFQ